MENFFQAHCLFREIVSRMTLLGELSDGGRGALLEDIFEARLSQYKQKTSPFRRGFSGMDEA